MRIIRYLIGSVFLLATLIMGAVTYLIIFRSGNEGVPRVPLQRFGIDADVSSGVVLVVVTVVLLILSVIIMPIGRMKKKPPPHAQQPAQPAPRDNLVVPASTPVQRAAPPVQRAAPQGAAMPESPPLPEIRQDERDPHQSQQMDEDMSELVAMEQQGITTEVFEELLSKFYPELNNLRRRIEPSCQSTIETLGLQIIEIARHKVKLRDPELSDHQFSIFQAKVFESEQMPVAQIYRPAATKQLNEAQTQANGMIYDKRDWEGAQRRILGDRTDWHQLSFANAKDLIA